MTDKPTPTDAEIRGLAATGNGAYQDDETAIWEITDPSLMKLVHAALEKWGQPAQTSKCTCTLAQRCTGSGCRYCNPQEYIDMLHDQIAENEPAQAAEPVAWRVHPFDYGIGHEGVYAMTMREDQREAWVRKGWMVEPLFAAPQPVAREPLSGKQAHKLLLDMTKHMDIFDTGRMTEDQLAAEAVRFLLAGASGHGIKGGQQ